MGTMALGKIGNLSQIVPFVSNFSPVSHQFRTFFIQFPPCISGNFPQFPISPPFLPPFSIPPIFLTSAAILLIRLRLTPMPEKCTTREAHARVLGMFGAPACTALRCRTA